MNFEKHQFILDTLINSLDTPIEYTSVEDGKQPYIELNKKDLKQVCTALKKTEGLFFDFLNCISAVDENEFFELWYHLTSIPLEHSFAICVKLPKNQEPEIESLASIWKTADWHERECFDLMGITFLNHPDLRRILLPADWVGHPLQKDYKEDEKYHGVNIKYDR